MTELERPLPEPADAELTRRAAEVLTELLSTREDYRRRWQRRMQRASRSRVHQAAVVAVLADHLWESGQVAESDHDLPRRLKHTVSRALSGHTLAPRTLQQLIEAFEMTHLDAARLWAARTGGDPLQLAVVRDEFAVRQALQPGPRYQTVSVQDFHAVGSSGLPRSHRTVHVVRALEELAKYTYRFDTDAATVEVLRGGTASSLSFYPEDGTFGVEIWFPRPLQPGETASFEYRTTFSYRSVPPPEFRRAMRARADNVVIHVEFSPERLPRRMWWATWGDHTEREPATREAVQLGPDHSTHRYVDTVRESVVGFVWEFDGPVRL